MTRHRVTLVVSAALLSVALLLVSHHLLRGQARASSRPGSILRGSVDGATLKSVCFSPSGNLLAIVIQPTKSSKVGVLQLWNAKSGHLIRELELKRIVQGAGIVSFLSEDKVEINASWYAKWHTTREERIWNVQTNKLSVVREKSRPVALSPTGDKFVRVVKQNVEILNSDDKAVQYALPIHNGAISFSPDGKTLAAVYLKDWPDDWHSKVQLWDVQSGNLLRNWDGPHIPYMKNSSFARATDIAFSSDGNTLIALLTEIKHEMGNIETGKIALFDLRSTDSKPTGILDFTAALPAECLSAMLSPDATVLALGSRYNAVRLWDVPSGKMTYTLRGSHKVAVDWNTAAPAIDFSPDSKVLAVSDGSMMRLWDVPTGKVLRNLK